MACIRILFLLSVIMMVPMVVCAEVDSSGYLKGRILGKNGESMEGGKVLIFSVDAGPPPSNSKYWRAPDHKADIGNDGAFSARLPEGKYYLRAIKRGSAAKLGPPEEGDYLYTSRDENGEAKTHLVKRNETCDIGTVAEAVPFSKSAVQEKGMTSIEGTVIDTDKKPVVGAVVLAYRTPEMTGRPLFVSQRTGEDGKFSLGVDREGVYYLKTRNGIGVRPVAGELMGSYGSGDVPRPVTIKTGEIVKGIDITVTRFTFTRKPGLKPKQIYGY
jgi:hypothetical protein